jgi:hypothetical protein
MNELIDESVERIFLCSTPIKWDTLLRQVVERCSNGAEISHETHKIPQGQGNFKVM